MQFSYMYSSYLDVKKKNKPKNKAVEHFFIWTWHSDLRCWGGLVIEGVWNAQKSPKMFLYVPKLIPNPWPQSDISEPNSSAPAWLEAMQGWGWRISWCTTLMYSLSPARHYRQVPDGTDSFPSGLIGASLKSSSSVRTSHAAHQFFRRVIQGILCSVMWDIHLTGW